MDSVYHNNQRVSIRIFTLVRCHQSQTGHLYALCPLLQARASPSVANGRFSRHIRCSASASVVNFGKVSVSLRLGRGGLRIGMPFRSSFTGELIHEPLGRCQAPKPIFGVRSPQSSKASVCRPKSRLKEPSLFLTAPPSLRACSTELDPIPNR